MRPLPVRLVRNALFAISVFAGAAIVATNADAVPVPEGWYFVPSSASVPADSNGSDPTPVVVPAAPPRQIERAPPPQAAPAQAAPQQRTAPQPQRTAEPPPLSAPRQSEQAVERALQRRMEPQQFQATMERMQEMQRRIDVVLPQGAAEEPGGRCCAPMADRFFDRAGEATQGVVAPAGTRAFGLGGGAGAAAPPPPPVRGGYQTATQQDVQNTTNTYQSIPGGVVLEGAANFGPIERISYDVRFNAFVLNDNTVYFAPIPPSAIAIMCRALQQDQRVGVSLGRVHIVYGGVPPNSDLALDLKIADHFLGDIVFAGGQWTEGYRFAQNYRPQANQGESFPVAVFFKFNGFRFEVRDGELTPAGAGLDVRLIPLSGTQADNGGHSADLEALARGQVSQQYEANARHVAENIGYYRNERIVNRMFAYGEVAAFLRGLRARGYDLTAIAARIEAPIS